MSLRRRLGINERTQERLVRIMELSLVGLFFVGLYDGNTGTLVNCTIALAVARVPALLERDFGVPLDAGLTLWITAAVFLHTFGTVGLPGAEQNLYQDFWWWDHLTHALSASVVAAAGYAVARAVDVHDDRVNIPGGFMFVFLLVITLAFGVFWEVIEFTLAEAAAMLGTDSVLTQYGIGDTMADLVFDSIGASIVAVWGTAHLTGVVGAITDYLGESDA